jgi:AbrB family looped-hinge helix DNA binding protein
MPLTTRISKDGRLAIPAEIRRRLGLKPGDTVTLTIQDDGRVLVEPVVPTADRATASFSVIPTPEPTSPSAG